MWIKNEIFKEDLDYICNVDFVEWSKLTGKSILITGGTGLIGRCFISSLLYRNLCFGSNIKIYALVRDINKAKLIFSEQLEQGLVINFVCGDVENLPEIEGEIDFIVHGASPTASNYFINSPVETIKAIVQGTINLLDLAVIKKVHGFLYLSSMEVYGAPSTDELIKENFGTTVDTMSIRSCYPEAKRLCESLCASYASEYHVPANAVRLAQTFGPGVLAEDNRVFSEFARSVVTGKNIVLKTQGKSKRCYLYNADAVTAILMVLLSNSKGDVFNVANAKTYCSIYEMAELVAREISDNKITVCVELDGGSHSKFPPEHSLNIDSSKLEKMGWKATKNLKEMYERMLQR